MLRMLLLLFLLFFPATPEYDNNRKSANAESSCAWMVMTTLSLIVVQCFLMIHTSDG